jgi:hypothetical protein
MPRQKPGQSKQDYRTPVEFLDAVRRRFNVDAFAVDLAADDDNHVAPVYYTAAEDALKPANGWTTKHGGLAWVQPSLLEDRPVGREGVGGITPRRARPGADSGGRRVELLARLRPREGVRSAAERPDHVRRLRYRVPEGLRSPGLRAGRGARVRRLDVAGRGIAMRNMSFALTTAQVVDGSKTVTRRLGWSFLRPGDQVRAVRKAMGLKKGERVEPLAVLQVVRVTREPLADGLTPAEVVREGFLNMTPADFVAMFCRTHKGCTPTTVVTRIEFMRAPATGR